MTLGMGRAVGRAGLTIVPLVGGLNGSCCCCSVIFKPLLGWTVDTNTNGFSMGDRIRGWFGFMPATVDTGTGIGRGTTGALINIHHCN